MNNSRFWSAAVHLLAISFLIAQASLPAAHAVKPASIQRTLLREAALSQTAVTAEKPILDSKILVKLNQNPRAYGSSCAINIFINGKFAFQNRDINLTHGYMYIKSTSEPLVDQKISWAGDFNYSGRPDKRQIDREVADDIKTCGYEKGEAWVGDLVGYEWKLFESRSSALHIKCVNIGLSKRGMRYYTVRQNQPGIRYLPFANSDVQQLVQRCGSLARAETSMNKGYIENAPCEVGGMSSLCNRGLVLSQNMLSAPLSEEQAIDAAIAGKAIAWSKYETAEGRKLRAQKALQVQAEQRKKELEIAKREEAERQRQAWLASPEGQRYLKAERERREQKVRKCLTENGFFATRNNAVKIRVERMCRR